MKASVVSSNGSKLPKGNKDVKMSRESRIELLMNKLPKSISNKIVSKKALISLQNRFLDVECPLAIPEPFACKQGSNYWQLIHCRRRKFPFRNRSLPFETVVAISQNGNCHLKRSMPFITVDYTLHFKEN